MAIIYSYQENEELRNSDRLVGTATTIHNGKVRKVTKNFSLGDLKTFINTGDLILSNGGTSGPATLIDNILNIPVYQGQITLTTTGSSGAATLIGNILNIPNYTTPTPTLDSVLAEGDTGTGKNITLTLEGDGIFSYGGVLSTFDNTDGNVGNATQVQPYAVIISDNIGQLQLSKSSISQGDGMFSTSLIWDTLLSNEVITIPNTTGTIALTSDLTGFVTSVSATSPITSTGGTTPVISTSMSTNKLIGRSTAGTGVMEEITIGTGLTLSGGILNGSSSGVTSVGLTMPSAFTVTNSPITSSGTIAVTGAGLVSQYVRGDGTLANFPNSTGGGASVNYYLNGSISQGTFGGDTYYQMSKTPILGAGTNFIRTNGAGNGYIASFITDAGDPSFLNIPGGNWNLELYFQSSASGGSPQFYGEIYKVSATNVFTLVASGSANPEGITNGTTIDQYFTSIPMPQTSLLITDRLAIRIYVITGGRTITLHTENGNLCEVLTTFTTGLTALNGLTSQVQYLAVGTSGTDFAISSATDTHTFNLPTASATNRGALSTTDWSAFNGKFNLPSLTSGSVLFSNGTTIAQDNANLFWNNTNKRLGVGTNLPENILSISATLPVDIQEDIFSIKNLNVTRTVINNRGGQAWFLNNGSSEVGRILYTTPSNRPGIVFFNSTLTGRSDIRQITGGGISIATTTLGTIPSDQFYFYPTGNFSINTTDSGFRLDVNGTTRLNGNTSIGGGAAGARLDVRAQGALSTDIALRVRNSADSADLLVTNGLGNVGIGTSSPSYKLDVQGTGTTTPLRVVSSGNTSILLSRAGTTDNGDATLTVTNTGALSIVAANVIRMAPNNSENARFTSIGLLIGTTTSIASSKLTIESTTQGFLPPRMTNAQRIAIATPAVGLCVYCTDVVEGLYINKSTGWTYIG